MSLGLEGVRRAVGSIEVAADLLVERETLAVVGPSGAGKSSLLRMVAGLLRPTRGRITVGGRTVFDASSRLDVPPEERRVGLVFQEYALFPHLSVAANVAYGPRALGWPRRQAAAEANGLLERLAIAHLGSARPATLSGGERQRVALARALAASPEVLLLDEPLSALDAATKGHVAAELSEILRDVGLPTILVSHDFTDVVGLADRIAVVESGRIVQMGTAAELLEVPASAFVAAFTGVNYFAGFAERRGDLTAVRPLAGGGLFLSTDLAEGAVGAVVAPWDVAVSTHPPDGSALNALSGPVRRVALLGNRARVSVGSEPPVVAEVTDGSARRLGLVPGLQVVATWKATGTRLVPRPG